VLLNKLPVFELKSFFLNSITMQHFEVLPHFKGNLKIEKNKLPTSIGLEVYSYIHKYRS
jgi:hypothetical protein